MPRISNIEVLKKNEQPIISIRTKTKVEYLPQLIGESFNNMKKYLKECCEYLSDIPFVAYHNMDMHNLDIEIGFPVIHALTGKDDIKPGNIPNGKIVFCMYQGAYNEIETTYIEMNEWIKKNGYEATGIAYEYYYNGMEFAEKELLTKIVIPIK